VAREISTGGQQGMFALMFQCFNAVDCVVITYTLASRRSELEARAETFQTNVLVTLCDAECRTGCCFAATHSRCEAAQAMPHMSTRRGARRLTTWKPRLDTRVCECACHNSSCSYTYRRRGRNKQALGAQRRLSEIIRVWGYNAGGGV
jgi:hypothetical protein